MEIAHIFSSGAVSKSTFTPQSAFGAPWLQSSPKTIHVLPCRAPVVTSFVEPKKPIKNTEFDLRDKVTHRYDDEGNLLKSSSDSEEEDDEDIDFYLRDSHPSLLQVCIGKTTTGSEPHWWWMPSGSLDLGQETPSQAASRILAPLFGSPTGNVKCDSLRTIGHMTHPTEPAAIVVAVDLTDVMDPDLPEQSMCLWVEPVVLLNYALSPGHPFHLAASSRDVERAETQWGQRGLLADKGIEEGDTPLLPALVSGLEALMAQEAWIMMQEALHSAPTSNVDQMPPSVNHDVMQQALTMVTTFGSESRTRKSYRRQKRDRVGIKYSGVHITDRQLRDPLTVALGFMVNVSPLRRTCRDMVEWFDYAVFLECPMPSPYIQLFDAKPVTGHPTYANRYYDDATPLMPEGCPGGQYRPLNSTTAKALGVLHFVNTTKFQGEEEKFGILARKFSWMKIANFPSLRRLKEFDFEDYGERLTSLTLADLPQLEQIDDNFCRWAGLKTFTLENLPNVKTVGHRFLQETPYLTQATIQNLPRLTSIGNNFLMFAGAEKNLTVTLKNLSLLDTIGDRFLVLRRSSVMDHHEGGFHEWGCGPPMPARVKATLHVDGLPQLKDFGKDFATKTQGQLKYTIGPEGCSKLLKEKLSAASRAQ